MRYLKIPLLYLLVFGLLFGCQPNANTAPAETSKHSDKVRNLNISVLLDLSDRIDTNLYPNKTMHYYQRDIGYLENIANSLEDHLKKKKIVLLNDGITTFVEPLPSEGQVIASLKALKVNINRDSKKEDVTTLSNTYVSNATNLYHQALKDGYYPGSDTYGFIQQKAKDYCIKENASNKLIIITDGYLYYKDKKIVDGNRVTQINQSTLKKRGYNTPQWEEKIEKDNFGFYVPNDVNLEGLEVLVLGIQSKSNNPFELQALSFIWKEWLESLGASKVLVKGDDLPLNLEQYIHQFIHN